MKVLPISLSFKSKNINFNNCDSEYLYTKQEEIKQNYLPQYSLVTGIVALAAVLITLFNIGSKR